MDSSVQRGIGPFKGLQETPCSGKGRSDLKTNPTRALFRSANSVVTGSCRNNDSEETSYTLKQQQLLKNQSELSPDSRELFDDLEEAEIAHQPKPSYETHRISDSSARPLATPALVRAQLDRAQSVVSSFRGAIPDSAAVVPTTAASTDLNANRTDTATAVHPTPNQRLAFSAVRQPLEASPNRKRIENGNKHRLSGARKRKEGKEVRKSFFLSVYDKLSYIVPKNCLQNQRDLRFSLCKKRKHCSAKESSKSRCASLRRCDAQGVLLMPIKPKAMIWMSPYVWLRLVYSLLFF